MNFGRKKKPKPIQIPSGVLFDGTIVLVCVLILSIGSMTQTLRSGSIDARIDALSGLSDQVVALVPDISALIDAGVAVGMSVQSLSGELQVRESALMSSLGPALESLDRFQFTDGLANQTEVIKELLGGTAPQTYLIALQNTNEIRPNGGFFGSYIRVTIDQGMISDLDVRDSYLPGFDRPGVGITGPQRLESFLPTREIHFIGANKIGFTYADAGHIISLYELAYPDETIRGVVMLRLDALLDRIPKLQGTITQRQFINAYANQLPRDSRQKKSNYIQQLEATITSATPKLLVELARDPVAFTTLGDIYLTDIPGSMHTLLRQAGLTTRFEESMLYARDSNISFSKTDGFVDRTIRCEAVDCVGGDCIVSDTERVNVSVYGRYTCTKTYEFTVPSVYRDQIRALEKEYAVTPGDREEHILGVDPVWGNRGVVYMSDQWEITGLTGEIYDESVFDTPFGQGLTYKVRMEGDQQTRVVQWTIRKKEENNES